MLYSILASDYSVFMSIVTDWSTTDYKWKDLFMICNKFLFNPFILLALSSMYGKQLHVHTNKTKDERVSDMQSLCKDCVRLLSCMVIYGIRAPTPSLFIDIDGITLWC